MIWITTLCLLAVALWLFFNALNERRWVDDHSHDETVASDEGLLPSLTGLTKTAEGGTPSNGESALERAAALVKTNTEKAKKSAGEMYDRAKQSDGALGENSTAARLASKTKEHAGKLNEKLNAGMKSAASMTSGTSADGSPSFLQKAAATSGSVTQKVAQSVKNSADNLAGKTNDAGDESMLSKIAGKVSSGMNAVDQKIGQSSAKPAASTSNDEVVSDVTAKVSAQVDKMDSKITDPKS